MKDVSNVDVRRLGVKGPELSACVGLNPRWVRAARVGWGGWEHVIVLPIQGMGLWNFQWKRWGQ